MHKILKVLVEEYMERKPSAEYQLIQHKVCQAEKLFIESLNQEQKDKYKELDFISGELDVQGFDDFAKFIFENLRKFY